MTATVTAVRAALKTRLESISGLNVHAFAPGAVTTPAAVIAPGDSQFFEYLTTPTTHDLQLVVGLFVSGGNDEARALELDAYLAPAGAQSILAAVSADPTLGGVVDSAEVMAARNYGDHTYGDLHLYGCEFLVSVLL